MGAHETIMKLRKELNIPEEKISYKEAERERRELEARAKRLELAETDENYVKLFNRDPWTDKWLGPGPEEPMPFLEDYLPKSEQKKAIEDRLKREHEEFIEKMGLNNKLPRKKLDEPKESKKTRKLRERLKKEIITKKAYQQAEWFLHEYAAPWYKSAIIAKCCYDVDTVVAYCNDQIEALEYLHQYEELNKNDTRTLDEKLAAIEERKKDRMLGIEEHDGIKWKPVNVAYSNKKEIEININAGIPDIPDDHWEEYTKWEKDKPLKKFKKKATKWGCSTITARRVVFLKMINKRNRKWQKSAIMTDPLTGMAFLSEKKMKKYNNQQIKRFAKQRKEYAEYVQKMVDKGYISEDYVITYLGDDKKAIDRVKQRYKQIEDRAKAEAKKHRRDEAHKRKRDKERIEWFKKYGYDVQDIDKPFEIHADGETLTLRPIISGKNKIWALDQNGSTRYEEKLENFMN